VGTLPVPRSSHGSIGGGSSQARAESRLVANMRVTRPEVKAERRRRSRGSRLTSSAYGASGGAWTASAAITFWSSRPLPGH